MERIRFIMDYVRSVGPDANEKLEEYRTRRPYLYNTCLTFLCIGLFISNVVQGVFFKRMADDVPTAPYFLLLFCSVMFVLIFGFAMIIRWFIDIINLKRSYKDWNIQEVIKVPIERVRVRHYWLAIIGFLDSVNGLILLFAAAKTPPMLHPILGQAIVLITFIAVYLFRTRKIILATFALDSLATLITMGGVMISLIPVFIAISNNPSAVTTSAIWPLVFLMGIILGAIMNVVQERATLNIKHLQTFDYLHMLTWVSIYQVITDLSLFWTNFINPSANIHNLQDLGAAFDKGFACLGSREIMVNNTIVGNCHHAPIDTGLFISGYIGTYVFTAYTINFSSSILTAITNAPVVPVVTLIFFLAGMDQFTWHVGIAIPIMMTGAIFQGISDHLRDKKEANECNNDEDVQLLPNNDVPKPGVFYIDK
jgi:hypothetical protein